VAAPLVSVLLPYRDAAESVELAMGSVLSQRGVDAAAIEVVCVDDGSRDAGPELVRRVAADDARVLPVSARGRGIVDALTTGLEVCRGELIARMDADDISLSDRFSRQIALLRADQRLGAAGTRVEAFVAGSPAGEIGEGLRLYLEWQNAVVTPEDHQREIFVESPLCHPSVMLRRSALEAVGGWRETTWAEDYDLWLRLHAAGYRLAKVPEVLLRWRHRGGRLTFSDPRYHVSRFLEAKGHYLAPRLVASARPVAVWGAGPTGRRLARALEKGGVHARLFVDIDPRKIGRRARGAPIVSPAALHRGEHTVVVAVGARGARELVRRQLALRGFIEGDDYICAA
jgi:glycosyltransferase involved in cell wall biosynthesis